jgi:hypothetical protein
MMFLTSLQSTRLVFNFPELDMIPYSLFGFFPQDELDSAIIYDRDFSYDYFGFKVCPHVQQLCESTVPGDCCDAADFGAVLPSQDQWPGRRAAAAHAYARLRRDTQGGHPLGH